MFTPRYLIWGTEERVWPWSVYLCMIVFFLNGHFFLNGYVNDLTFIWVKKDICQSDSHLGC